jgi:hypothetical protein
MQRALFAPHVHDAWTIRVGDATRTWRLVEVSEPTRTRDFESYSIMFEPDTPAAGQGTVVVAHPVAGDVELFVVAVAANRYEAVVSQLAPEPA